jgi:DNA polymerase III sliding clamp (beta) subunit (PCNA family)
MQFIIRRQFLLALLEKAWTVTIGGILSTTKGFYFVRKDDMITVARTDSVLSAVASTNVVNWVDKEGPTEFLVDAEKLLRLVRGLTSDEVRIVVTGSNKIIIAGDNFNAEWLLFDLSDFPRLPVYHKEPNVEIATSEFVGAIDRVRYAASIESLTSAYKQIYFENKSCWATDGYNFQSVETKIVLPDLIAIPLIGLDVVKFLRLSGVGSFFVSWDDNYYYFTIGNDAFICKRSSATPPNPFEDFYNKLSTPDIHKLPYFVFEVRLLRRIVERVAITGSFSNKRIWFYVTPVALTVKGVDEDGNASEEVLIILLNGDKTERTLGIHYELFLDALQSLRGESAELRIDRNHILITSKDSTAILPLLKK